MPYPYRMNLVAIKIAQLNKATTIVDSDYGQPITEKDRSIMVELIGQSSVHGKDWYALNRTRRGVEAIGDAPESSGHLCFKEKYLEAKGIMIKKDDQIIEIAGHSVDFIITEVRPQAPLRGRTRLIMVYFEEEKERR